MLPVVFLITSLSHSIFLLCVMSVAAHRCQTGKDGLGGGVFVFLYYITLPRA
jgi:hypothetical protein